MSWVLKNKTMQKIKAKPYNLFGKIQNYEWGAKNEDAFIPNFLGEAAELDVPYAEYWIGVHPKAPSEILIENQKYNLVDVIKENSNEILGERIAEKFNNTLPFLLKILSINKALSIQAHPDKSLAKLLHTNDPANYPDENHKPEIAIALDNLKAIVGLKEFHEIKLTLENYSEIKTLISDETLNDLFNSKNSGNNKIIEKLYAQIMNSSKEKLEKCILLLKKRFESKSDLAECESQFLIQYENYGSDIGLISLLLFNMLNLESGEAIFTPAGIPHAYIKGNIIECMANSDNVVRAGLTPKFKDIKTLTEMLVVDSQKSEVKIIKNEDTIIYKTTAEEFEVSKLNLSNQIKVNDNSEMFILIILSGEVKISFSNSEIIYKKGETVLIPSILNSFTISGNEKSLVYSVCVPV